MNAFRVPLSSSTPAWMPPSEVHAFSGKVGVIDDVGVITKETTAIQTEALPWWKGRRLIIARDPHWGGVMSAWVQDEQLHRLDGTSAPIHALNAIGHSDISAEHAIPYLGFFCTFVHGPEGPFAIATSPEDPMLPPGARSGQAADFLRPVTLLRSDEKGHHIEAVVCYGSAIFLSKFIVSRNGMCGMLEDLTLTAIEDHIDMKLRFKA